MAEKPPQKPPQPLLNLQLYQEEKKKFDQQRPQIPTLNPLNTFNPFIPPQYYTGGILPFYNPTYVPYISQPIIKTYEINTSNPSSKHANISLVFEDVLPVKDVAGTFSTIGERLTLHGFVRSSILSNSDGHNMSFDNGESNAKSLMSYLKFNDLNPYNTYKYSNNPYKGMPSGFLIYRSCYPIRHNKVTSTVMCAKDSSAVNIRIYRLTEGAFFVGRLKREKFADYEEWREIAFYEYIRNNIIKQKISPNFVNLYGYVIAENSGIDFDEIDVLKAKEKKMAKGIREYDPDDEKLKPKYAVSSSFSVKPKLDDIVDTAIIDPVERLYRILNPKEESPKKPEYRREKCPESEIIQYVNSNNRVIKACPNSYFGKALVALTESPTYSIIGWATQLKKANGNVIETINRGSHTDMEWKNVLFQLMASLYVMQIHGLVINNFSLEKNVFIKDIGLRGQVVNYWKYKIDGIDYYIPNLGYLTLIDSNYKDLPVDSFESTIVSDGSKEHKLDGKFMGDKSSITDEQIKEKTFEMLRKAFDPNNFTKEFTDSGVIPPDDEIKTLLGNIQSEINTDAEKDISKYIHKYMKSFMNNRIGTLLKETEITNVRRDDLGQMTKGQMVVHDDAVSGYMKFVLFLENKGDGSCSIITKGEPTSKDNIEITIPITSLYNYSKADPIQQTYKPNEANLSDEDLLETYIIHKNK